MISIGDTAPDFSLTDTEGGTVSLADLRGTPVSLVFIPFAFTGICTGELCDLRDNPAVFADTGSRIVVVTCDRAPSLKEWKSKEGFDFPLLSDGWPHGEVARAYGVFMEDKGCAQRATVVIDGDGTVVDAFATGGLGEPRAIQDYAEALSKL